MMLQMPRQVETKARVVGTQVWKAEETRRRYVLVGVQCGGRLVAKKLSCGDMRAVPKRCTASLNASPVWGEQLKRECEL